MRNALATALVVTLMLGVAHAETLYDSQGFEDFTLGSLVGAPQDGWEGFAFEQGGEPMIVDLGGNQALKLEVFAEPASDDFRQESRVLKTFAGGIDLTQYTDITISYDLTLTAGNRHNLYFDFDSVPNKFLGNAQIVQDNGYVQMVRQIGGSANGQNVAQSGTTAEMRWEFDLVNGTVDSFFGDTQIDTNSPVSLQALINDQLAEDPDGDADTFDVFSLGLVKDFRTAPWGDTMYVDNFVVTGIPEPASLTLLTLAGLLLRRR